MEGLQKWLARLTLAAACVSAVMLIGAGVGHGNGVVDFKTGVLAVQLAILGCAIAVVAALVVGLLGLTGARAQGRGQAFVGFLVAKATAAFPLYTAYQARVEIAEMRGGGLPIHDVTTDTEDPPVFVALLPLRAKAFNPADYGGPEVAAVQVKLYPDIKPHLNEATPAELFARAKAAAEAMGWEIVDANADQGRIEATATTLFFGFKDDVVIRIRSEGAGSRLDIRSVSREGLSDLGVNAKRIREFMTKLG